MIPDEEVAFEHAVAKSTKICAEMEETGEGLKNRFSMKILRKKYGRFPRKDLKKKDTPE